MSEPKFGEKTLQAQRTDHDSANKRSYTRLVG